MNLNFGRLDLETKLKELFLSSMTGNSEDYEKFLQLVSVLVKRSLFYLGQKAFPAESLEDLHQDIMMKIHLKKHTFLLTEPILPWIYAITRYGYFDSYRKSKRSPKEVELKEEHWVSTNLENFLNFDDIVAYLTPKQINMLQLVKIEGQSYQQAAQSLQMSVPALKVGIHRIIDNLRKKVNK